ncbi:MAG: LPXTG cell wall anchor domain-containing protein [Ruminiclostridium sp.]|nr:LPXTG cell wall anchor domain-containing protein [Ruminiclostridium sp.]
MKLRKILAGVMASAVAASAMAVSVSAEPVEQGIFVIGFGDADWKASFWGKDGDILDSSYEQTAKLEGNGIYTISLDLSGGYTNPDHLDEETGDEIVYTTGNGIGAMGIQIYGEYPTLGVDIQSVKFDGVEFALTGASYTNDEDGGRRTNIYNAWAAYDAAKEDHITKDPATATSTVVDISSLTEWSKVEVTFEVYGLEETAAPEAAAPEADAPATDDTATEAPATGDVAGATDSSKGSPDTGIEDVAVVAGLAIVAGGAVLVSKKRK